jgi:hypothetical protein
MDKDLQLVGLGIAFLVGFGLVKGTEKKELQDLGKIVNVASAVLTVAHLANRLSGS